MKKDQAKTPGEQMLKHWGVWYSEKHKLIVYAPPRCGSTSILSELEKLDLKPKTSSTNKVNAREHSKELLIHHRNRSHCNSKETINKAMKDESYMKILITRDPLKRLVSSIISKYMIPNSQFEKEIKGKYRKSNYNTISGPEDLSAEINRLAEIIIDNYKNMGMHASHCCPITEIIKPEQIILFNKIVKTDTRSGFRKLECILNKHVFGRPEGKIAFGNLNKSPIKTCGYYINKRLAMEFVEYYKDDYGLLKYEPPDIMNYRQKMPSRGETDKINLYISLTERFYTYHEYAERAIQELRAGLSKAS